MSEQTVTENSVNEITINLMNFQEENLWNSESDMESQTEFDFAKEIMDMEKRYEDSKKAFAFCNWGPEYTNLEAKDLDLLGEEVGKMLKSAKNLHAKLSLQKLEESENVVIFPEINDVTEREAKKQPMDYTAFFEKIEKMDSVLRSKFDEEKKAKLNRIQVEEESIKIINEIPESSLPSAIKINSQEFLNLLNEVKKKEPEKKTSKESISSKKIEKEEEKPKTVTKVKSSHSFIQRNIQLARCGRGTLSLTEEEQKKVQNLVDDNDDAYSTDTENSYRKNDILNKSIDLMYGIDEATKAALAQIDEKLKKYSQPDNVESSISKLSLTSEENDEDDEEKKAARIKKNNLSCTKNKPKNLTEINKLLDEITSVSSKEFYPLSQQEIESLIEKAKESLEESKNSSTEENPENKSEETEKSKTIISKDVIDKLVSNAKINMPKFKYNFI